MRCLAVCVSPCVLLQNGSYFTTKIWEFQMKCPSCSNQFIIRTDPKNSEYDYVEGIKKKEMEYDPTVSESCFGEPYLHVL